MINDLPKILRELAEIIEREYQKEYISTRRVINAYGGNYDWRELEKESLRLGYEVKELKHPDFSQTPKLYHKDVWKSLYRIDTEKVK